jgi:hypothetical protein
MNPTAAEVQATVKERFAKVVPPDTWAGKEVSR